MLSDLSWLKHWICWKCNIVSAPCNDPTTHKRAFIEELYTIQQGFGSAHPPQKNIGSTAAPPPYITISFKQRSAALQNNNTRANLHNRSTKISSSNLFSSGAPTIDKRRTKSLVIVVGKPWGSESDSKKKILLIVVDNDLLRYSRLKQLRRCADEANSGSKYI